MNYSQLPVYRHKDLILAALETHQVVVVESPTGSGKTTQLPVILHGAGYSCQGIIGVTQPRRIAAVSVSEYIARQIGQTIGGLVGYKMRFEDKTGDATRIKIMTDGILLQEMKLDPFLSKYGCLVVDEAHERSLNIDFILGLLKRILEARPEFKVIVSSATINAQVFSEYFGQCPVVKIDAITYPVTLIYDPPEAAAPFDQRAAPNGKFGPRPGREAPAADRRSGPVERRGGDPGDILLDKIVAIVERIIGEQREGDILIFLSGEKIIKTCMTRLSMGPVGGSLHLVPLYGRLGKDEQERVFDDPPRGKTKVVISTNIAETSVTIDGITTVIDSGLAKLNFYNPRTFTSSLVEGPVSKASANQRKGRAGRTREGTCYRLYARKDFENRPLFTTEEIFRTDLSEVVLRMADLGISAFEEFDFISPPGREGLIAAIETLNLLDALLPDRSLSKIGKMMTEFPLPPRQSRIIVEAILKYPEMIQETIIAAAFLSTQSPYVLPPGEETDARKAHHSFRDSKGDFVSYLRLYHAYKAAANRSVFCERSYLDERAMAEIANVTEQLELIVSGMGVPIVRKPAGLPHTGLPSALSGREVENYLSSVARGLIQFVCVREGRDMYRSLTADRILIHPGSVMFKMDPQYIVAGEIVRTTRMYAMSVSPLSRDALEAISPQLFESLRESPGGLPRGFSPGAAQGRGDGSPEAASLPAKRLKKARDFTNAIKIGDEVFDIETRKGKKMVKLPWERLSRIKGDASDAIYKGLKGVVIVEDSYTLLAGEKLSLILSLVPSLDIEGSLTRLWPRKEQFLLREDPAAILSRLPDLVNPAIWRQGKKELGFIGLFTDGNGTYWFRCSRGFITSLNESLSSLETLIDDLGDGEDAETKEIVNQTYRRLSSYL